MPFLGKLAGLKLGWAEIPEAGMKALTVVKDFNEGKNLLFCLLARAERGDFKEAATKRKVANSPNRTYFPSKRF